MPQPHHVTITTLSHVNTLQSRFMKSIYGLKSATRIKRTISSTPVAVLCVVGSEDWRPSFFQDHLLLL